MIVLIDNGMGNIGSIVNKLKNNGEEVIVSSDPSDLSSADRFILPGVGSFDNAMKEISKNDMNDILYEEVIRNSKPILGICLGIQVMSNSSEEGSLPGLGLLNARVKKFHFPNDVPHLKIPHMGWNTVSLHKDCVLFDSMDPDAEFYFTHSYHLEVEDPDIVVGTTHYGYDFPSVIQKDNIYAVQFHPEKSHKYGMKLLQNFLELT